MVIVSTYVYTEFKKATSYTLRNNLEKLFNLNSIRSYTQINTIARRTVSWPLKLAVIGSPFLYSLSLSAALL